MPAEWAQRRAIGSAAHHGQYADIYESEWICRLRRELARDCVRLGVADIDASVLQGSAPRSLTQHASRIIYNAGFDGICYHSRYGHEIRNWGVFEPFKLDPQRTSDVTTDDPDFRKALQIHGLQIRP